MISSYLLILTLMSSSFATEPKHMIKEDLPKCNFIRKSLSLNADDVATFVCICNPKSRRYRGTLSAVMDEPLSTIPLHLVMAGKVNFGRDIDSFQNFEPGISRNSRIEIELKQCDKIKLKVDFPALFMTRPGGTGSDVTLKISDSNRVHLSRIQVLPDLDHNIVLQNISGKVLISGKMDCLGCSNVSKGAAATDADSLPTLLKIDAFGLSESLNLEGVSALVPLKLTYRESNLLSVRRSRFSLVPWPGFYIYNVTSAYIKENSFKDVAPRSLVARSGQHLEITDNILTIANVLDVSSYTYVTIKCNRANEFESLPTECNLPTDLDGLPYQIPSIRQSPDFILVVGIIVFFGHVWLIIIALGFLIVAGYKFSVGSNEHDNPPRQQQTHFQNYYPDYSQDYCPQLEGPYQVDLMSCEMDGPRKVSRDTNFSSCLKGSSVEPVGIVKFKAGPTDPEDDEYSTSSRLHLAGCGNTGPGSSDWVNGTPGSSPTTSLSASRSHPYSQFQMSPILHQLESLSIESPGAQQSTDGSEIYYNGSGNFPLSHIDSDIEIVPHNGSRVLRTPQEMYCDYPAAVPQRRFQWQYTKV